MFLSTAARLSCLLIGALLFQACGTPPSNAPAASYPVGRERNGFPFSTIEPEVYTATIIVRTGTLEKRWNVARDGAKWRVDIFDKGETSHSMIGTDRSYVIDHRKRTYFAAPAFQGVSKASEIASQFFIDKEFYDFEHIGEDGGLTKYKAKRRIDGKGFVFLFIDSNNLVVRQELFDQEPQAGEQPPVVRELLDLKLSADESLFRLPDGYTEVRPGGK